MTTATPLCMVCRGTAAWEYIGDSPHLYRYLCAGHADFGISVVDPVSAHWRRLADAKP